MTLTQILLDAPATPATRVQIAKLGSFKDKRYGAFDITALEVAAWKKNLALLPGSRAAIDLDHSADRPQPFRSTEAAGWVTDVNLDGDKAYATLEWTPLGAQAIREKRYLFFSPSYGPFTTEDGTKHDDVLTGGALTNRPFLNMPAIQLASADTMQRALDQDPAWHLFTLAESGDLDVKALLRLMDQASDSRPAMKVTPKIRKQLGVADDVDETIVAGVLKSLGIADDADEAAVITTLEGFAKPAEETTPTETAPAKTLEQLAADAGMKILDAATFTQLVSGAAAGQQAAKELHEAKFATGWTAAVNAGKYADAERPTWERFYELDAEHTLKTLDEAPVRFNMTARGANIPADANAPLDPMEAADKAARKLMADNGLPESDYVRCFEAALEGRTQLA